MKLFNNFKQWPSLELWYSGEKNRGENEYYRYGRLRKYAFYNDNGLLDGEYKLWDLHGRLDQYVIYKDGKIVKDLL